MPIYEHCAKIGILLHFDKSPRLFLLFEKVLKLLQTFFQKNGRETGSDSDIAPKKLRLPIKGKTGASYGK